jgi:predicted aspartyl protease
MRRLLIPVLVTMSVIPAAAADRSRTGGVPLSIDGKGGVMVEVQVNDAGPFRFLIDTGAARSVVADDLAAAVGAPAVAKTAVVTSGGSDTRLVVRLDSIRLSSVKVDAVLAPVVPAPQLARLGRGVRGLLGQDFLSAFNYTLDYRRARLTWDEALSCGGRDAVRMQPSEGRFTMLLHTGDGRAMQVVPDSGAEVPVFFRDFGLGSASAAAMVTGLGAGIRAVVRSTLPELRVGGVTLRDLDAYLVERPDAGADAVLPLHGFSSVSFAAGGACIVARR